MNQELEQFTARVGDHLRLSYPQEQGWKMKTNVDCGGAIVDYAITRSKDGRTKAIPVMIVAGHWITPIYSRILFKWKASANSKGIIVPKLLLFGRPGTVKESLSATIAYKELEQQVPFGRVG